MKRYLAMAAALLVAMPSLVQARQYSAADLSQVSSEEDLRDLYAQDDITEAELEDLLELIQSPVDVNRARRETFYQLPKLSYENVDELLKYRNEKGPFKDLASMLDVPGLNAEIMANLAPFAVALPPLSERLAIRGSVRVRSALTTGNTIRDGLSSTLNNQDVLRSVDIGPRPETYIRAKVASTEGYDAGVVLLEQQSVAAWQFDRDNLNFHLTYGNPSYSVEKLYVVAKKERFNFIVGSYSAGFGERLVFDNSSRSRPDGWYRDARIQGASNFNATERLFGVAGTWNPTIVGSAQISGTAFLSWKRYDLYQNSFVVSPPAGADYGIYAYGTSPDGYLSPGVELPYVTYPNMYSEAIGGAHITVELPKGHVLGATAYLSHIDKKAPIDFTNALPDRPFFGAYGVDFSSYYGKWTIAGEAAMSDSGGGAAYARAVRGLGQGEARLSFRHYGTNYDNPHSRGSAQPDTYSSSRSDDRDLGDPAYDPENYTSLDRDRDEQGFRFQTYQQLTPRLELTGYYDQWRHPSSGNWDLDTQLRANVNPLERFEISGFFRYQDKVLSQFGRGRSFDTGTTCDPNEDPEGCGGDESTSDDDASGSRLSAGVYLVSKQLKTTTIWAHYRRYYEDARRENVLTDCSTVIYAYRVGQIASLKSTTTLPKQMQAAVRLYYQDEDVYGNSGVRELGTYAQLQWRSSRQPLTISGRYSLDTNLRDPADSDIQYCVENNPETHDFRTSQYTDDERLRTAEQTFLVTIDYRF